MTTYNKHYQKENYFGKSYPELIKYLSNFERSKLILDLGCGQGRDVIALGMLGFTVKGVDISRVGINQLNKVASTEKLNVIGEVEDYKLIDYLHQYDVILMNSMFHFYKNDILEETKSIKNVLQNLKTNGRLIVIIQENQFRVKHLKRIIDDFQNELTIEHQESFLYQEFNTKFYMISVRKDAF